MPMQSRLNKIIKQPVKNEQLREVAKMRQSCPASGLILISLVDEKAFEFLGFKRHENPLFRHLSMKIPSQWTGWLNIFCPFSQRFRKFSRVGMACA